MLEVRRPGRPAGRPRRRRVPARAEALKTALRGGVETLVAAIADRAAEDVAGRWQEHPAGAALLDELTAAGSSGPPGEPPFTPPAELEFAQPAANGSRPEPAVPASAAALARSSPDLAARTARAISAWQDHVMLLIQAESVTKRSVARVATFDDESLALVLTIGMLGYGAGDVAVTEGTSAVPQRVLTTLFGAGPLRDLGARARLDLHDRITLLFAEEMRRFTDVIDAAGKPGPAAAADLYQAAYALEAAR
jgi:hypothetical protein